MCGVACVEERVVLIVKVVEEPVVPAVSSRLKKSSFLMRMSSRGEDASSITKQLSSEEKEKLVRAQNYSSTTEEDITSAVNIQEGGEMNEKLITSTSRRKTSCPTQHTKNGSLLIGQFEGKRGGRLRGTFLRDDDHADSSSSSIRKSPSEGKNSINIDSSPSCGQINNIDSRSAEKCVETTTARSMPSSSRRISSKHNFSWCANATAAASATVAVVFFARNYFFLCGTTSYYGEKNVLPRTPSSDNGAWCCGGERGFFGLGFLRLLFPKKLQTCCEEMNILRIRPGTTSSSPSEMRSSSRVPREEEERNSPSNSSGNSATYLEKVRIFFESLCCFWRGNNWSGGNTTTGDDDDDGRHRTTGTSSSTTISTAIEEDEENDLSPFPTTDTRPVYF